jgi:hypothetical protein
MRRHSIAVTRGRRKKYFIPIEDVLYFKTEDKYVLAHHINGKTLIDGRMKDLESEFDSLFVRTHRQYLVAINQIESITAGFSITSTTTLKNGDILDISRRHLKMVVDRFHNHNSSLVSDNLITTLSTSIQNAGMIVGLDQDLLNRLEKLVLNDSSVQRLSI